MSQLRNLTITFIASASFLLTSTLAFADNSQPQNKVDNKENSSKQSQPQAPSKKESDVNKSGQDHPDTRSGTAPPASNPSDPAKGADKKGGY